jgi:invasion protein IalB
MRRSEVIVAFLSFLGCGVISHAATLTTPIASPSDTLAPSNPKTSTTPGWLSRCVSDTRKGPFVCSVEETIILASTGQAVASVIVRPEPEAKKLVMTIRVPVGLYLPAGLNVKVDDSNAQFIPLQTCDVQGCYAEAEISPALAAALKSGKQLSIICQDTAKKQIVLPLTLDGFATAFERIQ